MSAYGLQTHIWNNNLRSALLLAGFPVLLLSLTYGLFLLYAGMTGAGYSGETGDGGAPFVWAAQQMGQSWPFAFIGALVWFAIAYLFNQQIIDASVGAREVTRLEEPALYNTLETLCISRGLKTPHLRVIESEALNAFASGINEEAYSITVTRGLMQVLTGPEMEAVLGHELTHIRNRDVRLMVIAVVFVGIFSFVGQTLFRMLLYGPVPTARRRGRDDEGGPGLAIVVGLALIAASYALAIIIRFSLSRRREYLADAGSVELTKNPDALISALRKISGHSEIVHAPAEVREMFIENDSHNFADLFDTHPPIEDRIRALIAYAGGRDGPGLAGAVRAPGDGALRDSAVRDGASRDDASPDASGAASGAAAEDISGRARPGPWDDPGAPGSPKPGPWS